MSLKIMLLRFLLEVKNSRMKLSCDCSPTFLWGIPNLFMLLLITDAHKDWCGPCENMLPTYNLLLRDIEQCENRINFATADRGLFLEQLKVVAGEGSVFDIATHGCEPIFLFVKGGKVVHSVLGANAGDVLRAAKEHVSPISTDDD